MAEFRVTLLESEVNEYVSPSFLNGRNAASAKKKRRKKRRKKNDKTL